MQGKAYARALRGHMLSSAALLKHMQEQRPGCLSDVTREHIRTLHQYLMEELVTDEQFLQQDTDRKFFLC